MRVCVCVQVDLKEMEEVMLKMKGEIETMETEEAGKNEKLMDVRHELEKYVAKMKENQHKVNHFKAEVHTYYVL